MVMVRLRALRSQEQNWSVMLDPQHNPQVSIPPEEDARLSCTRGGNREGVAPVASEVRERSESKGATQIQIRETALWCVQVLDEYQNRGLNPDQGREAIRAFD